MLNTLQRYRARKEGDENALGFTLIELLIVIVVLGILAAVTVFALSGVSGTSAQATCNSDASTVNTAVAAFDAQTGYVTGSPGTTAIPVPTEGANGLLVAGTPSYLQSWPTSSHYTIHIISVPTTGYTLGTITVTGNVAGTAATAIVWAPGSGNAACSSTNVK